MGKVWVLYLDEGHNEKVRVFAHKILAYTWLYDYVIANWFDEGLDEEPPIQPAEAIHLYFEGSERCSYYLGECEVIES